MILLSKKLLSAVTGTPISKSIDELGIIRVIDITSDYDGSYLNFKYQDQESSHLRYFNLYELAHKCKDWAYIKKNISINSYRREFYVAKLVYNKSGDSLVKMFYSDNNEPEAIFKACEWVLENLKDK